MGEKRDSRIRNQYTKSERWLPVSMRWILVAMGSGLLLLFVAWIWWGGGTPSSTQSGPKYADLQQKFQALKQKNSQLREQIQRLREQNQALRSRRAGVRNSSGTYIERPQRARSGSRESTVASDSLPVEGPGEDEKLDPSMWIQVVGVAYPIRSERLRQPIIYRTGTDDTLTRLAHQYYHDSRYWRDIYEYNQERLASPDRLPPGTRLRLPPLSALRSSS